MFFIRTANDRDLEKVRVLLGETWHATYDALYGVAKVQKIIDTWHSAAALKARLAKKGGEFLVADDGKRLGGMGFAAMADNMAKTAILHQLYVHPSCHRQGIGTDILAELETCFPDAEILRLDVEPKNTGAVTFYTAHGFVEVDRTQNCGAAGSGIEGLVMEKPLVNVLSGPF
ncbi:GNAT family N-acetyltransferase [Agrobacterium vitis]|uniref:GNAT family N-acetyltransferase n=1 Tax=Agrobacterium vitis TaxID=373 RepID=UPI002035C6D6|nr:GNAT family N-acetyltransferase [Agrobacterium vitis]MCM2451470.1 GNAT family N-acetyltransferase [Agrobacterium vitis]